MSIPKALDVVGIGYCVWDYLGIVERMPKFDGPVLQLLQFAASGGGPVSTALVALARLGARTGYVGVIGDDDVGANIRRSLAHERVDLSRVRVEAGARSSPCMVLVQAKTGKRSILHNRGTHHPLELQDEDRPYITAARFLHLDGQHMAAAITAAQWMRRAGRSVVLDANRPRPRLDELLPSVDVLITNASFPCAYTGQQDLEAAADRLLSTGARLVVVTQAGDGCTCFTRDRRWDVPGFEVEVVDTTGAGDAFHGAFIYGLLQDWPIPRTATFANAVAALNCTALGGQTGLPKLHEVEAFLQSRGTSSPPARHPGGRRRSVP